MSVAVSLEEKLNLFAEALEKGRKANWEAGDIIAMAIGEHGKGVIPAFAEVGACSAMRIKQLAVLSATFPSETRSPEQEWSWFLKVYQKAKALGKDPLDFMQEALDAGWSMKEINDLGKEKGDKVRKEFKHDACLVSFAVSGAKGTAIRCPVCCSYLGEL